jgi:hypothetical protein
VTGALLVLGVLGAYFAWGSTPEGDTSPGNP